MLLVGAGFGMIGYILQFGISKIPGFGSLVDSIALTVILSAFIVRLVFGRTSIFGNLPDGAGWGRFAPRDDAAWVRWHEKFVPNTVLGFGAGLLAAGVCLKLAEFYPSLGRERAAYTFVFGISAMSLLFLSLGLSFPVTHHITIMRRPGRAEVPADRRGPPDPRHAHRRGRRDVLGLVRGTVRPALA